MRILWLAPNGGNYKNTTIKGTGGWIGALQSDLVQKYPDIEIGIAFDHSDSDVIKDGNTTYYPVCTSQEGRLKNALSAFLTSEKKKEQLWVSHISQILNSFSPDVVHIWGIENTYAAVIPYIKCSHVVHIQGLMSLYIYAYLPPSFSVYDIRRCDSWLNPKSWIKRALHIREIDKYHFAQYRSQRELHVSGYVKNWIGRTDWDFRASQLLSPNSKYFHCDEIMRKDFDGKKWHYHYNGEVLKIQSSISEPLYKGVDLVLRTAKLLTEHGLKLEWNIYGVSRDHSILKLFIKHLKLYPEELGVNFLGHVDGSMIRNGLLNCDMYVHPSYIENSSNAIAEAMLMGVPTIAQNVGGNASMLKNSSGLLISPNEPYMMASGILDMANREIAEKYSLKALAVAEGRQNPNTIVENLVNIYRQII